MTNLQPVILSGGAGTRLWPLSREMYPKQFLRLTGDKTMLQQTVDRVAGLSGVATNEPIVVCNEEHRFLVAEQLRQIGISSSGIMLEPVGRNTAPALTIAALHDLATGNDDILVVMPADHVIRDSGSFHTTVLTAVQLAEGENIVTFGIVPTGPETGFGYIKKGNIVNALEGTVSTGSNNSNEQPCSIAAFVEKPDLPTATDYVSSGDYLWNSGMFVVKASTWLKAIERFRPDMFSECEASYKSGSKDEDFYRVEKDRFSACPADSIDYAVMERLSSTSDDKADSSLKSVVVPLDAGWSDIGAWSALWDVEEKSDSGNVVRGDVIAKSTTNSFLSASGRLLATVGVKDLVVVETPDAVLVADKANVQDLKAIVQDLKAGGRDEHLNHRRVHRPWGAYETIDLGERYQVKRITVNPGASLSLQMHHHRAEHWVIVSGTAKVTRDTDEFLVSENESTYIPVGVKHRLENPGKFPLEMIEVQSGTYLGEDDIVRFDDRYGRSK